MKIAIEPTNISQAYHFSVGNATIISGREATVDSPAVAGAIESTLSFYDITGALLQTKQCRITPEQYAAWDATVYDDEAYFLACHVANENLKTATE